MLWQAITAAARDSASGRDEALAVRIGQEVVISLDYWLKTGKIRG